MPLSALPGLSGQGLAFSAKAPGRPRPALASQLSLPLERAEASSLPEADEAEGLLRVRAFMQELVSQTKRGAVQEDIRRAVAETWLALDARSPTCSLLALSASSCSPHHLPGS